MLDALTCNNCGASLKIKKPSMLKVLREVKCSKCGNHVPVTDEIRQAATLSPETDDRVASPRTIRVPRGMAKRASSPTPTPPEHKEEVPAQPGIDITCPGCGRQMTVRKAFAGKKVKCRDCGHVTPVPMESEQSDPPPAEDRPPPPPPPSPPGPTIPTSTAPPPAEPVPKGPAATTPPPSPPPPSPPPHRAQPLPATARLARPNPESEAELQTANKRIAQLEKWITGLQDELTTTKTDADRNAEKEEDSAQHSQPGPEQTAALAQKETQLKSLKSEMAAYYAAEIEAAKRRINDLQNRLTKLFADTGPDDIK